MLFRLVIAADFLLALLPPLHWWVSSDGPGWSLAYFIGTTVFITASLYLLAALDRAEHGEVE